MKTTWVTGHHAVKALLNQHPERAISLFVVVQKKADQQKTAQHSPTQHKPSNPRAAQQQIIKTAQQLGLSVQTVDKSKLTKLCQNSQHQGVAIQAKPKKEGGEKELLQHLSSLLNKEKSPLILILDQVQDPHNLGACLRTADAAGVDAVIIPKDNASPITSVVQKVASGAAETVALFRVSNLGRVIDQIKKLNIWVLGTSDKAKSSLYQQNLAEPVAIVMGAEGSGIRQLTQKKCDTLINLPMAGQVVSSLNVSVATGVCLYEAVRQRQN